MQPSWLGVALAVVATGHLGAQTPARPAYVIERWYQHARYEASGAATVSLSVRVRVETESALQAFGQLTFGYASASDSLTVDSVRVHKVGGGVVTASASDIQDMNGPLAQAAPMYSDLRQKIVTVRGLRPGDTLAYRVTWTTHTPVAPGHFWTSFGLVDDAVVLDQRITIDVPRSRHVQVKSTSVEPEVTEAGDRRVYRWRHANPAVDTARSRPRRDRPRSMYVTTFRSWDEVGRWYADLVRDRAVPTARIRQTADSLVRGRLTLRDSIAALYHFVSAEFRYVSLSFGVGRYQPHPAAEVLANQYGDCKDKHVLLAALLAAINVRAEPALISSTTDIEPDVPSPSQFDHLITFVVTPQDSMWLDATPGVAPYQLLLLPLRDKHALVISSAGAARLLRTPANPPFAVFDSVGVTGEITDVGGVRASVTYVLRGDIEVLVRGFLRQLPPEQWTDFARSMTQNAGLAGNVTDAQGGDPRATTAPFQFTHRLDQSTPATWLDRRAELVLPLPRNHTADTSAADTIELGVVTRHVMQAVLRLPPGMTARLPLPVSASRPYADYRATYAMDGATISARRELTVKQAKVAPSLRRDYASFRSVIRDDEEQTVTLIRASDAPAAARAGNVDELLSRGRAALSNRDPQAAVRAFREVVQLEPLHRSGWGNLGRAFMDLGRVDSATAAFRRQITITPEDPYAHNNLGWALWRARKLDEAERVLQHALELSPLDSYAHGTLGRIYLEQRRDSAAVASLERATKVSANDAPLHLDLGKAYARVKRADDAVSAFARAVELAPHIGTWNTAAYQLSLAGIGLERAAVWARAAVDAATVDLRDADLDGSLLTMTPKIFWLGAVWDTLGWIYFKLGELSLAERFVWAAWLLRGTGEVGEHLGQIYERQGRRDAARSIYAMAAGGFSPSAEARRRLTRTVGAQRVEQQISGARVRYLDQRTFKLGKADADLELMVQVLMTPAGITDVRRISGAPLAAGLERRIKRINTASWFPDTTMVRIQRRASVTCTSGGECIMMVFDLASGLMQGSGTRDTVLIRER